MWEGWSVLGMLGGRLLRCRKEVCQFFILYFVLYIWLLVQCLKLNFCKSWAQFSIPTVAMTKVSSPKERQLLILEFIHNNNHHRLLTVYNFLFSKSLIPKHFVNLNLTWVWKLSIEFCLLISLEEDGSSAIYMHNLISIILVYSTQWNGTFS